MDGQRSLAKVILRWTVSGHWLRLYYDTQSVKHKSCASSWSLAKVILRCTVSGHWLRLY
jgi:hypothetical protein